MITRFSQFDERSMRSTELSRNTIFPHIKDFLSFEFIFIVSVFAGTYKGHPVFENANLFMDITLLTCLISMVVGFFVFSRRPFVPKEKMVFFFVYIVFIVYVILSWNLHGLPGERVLKLQKFIVFNTWSLCGPILIIDNRTRILRFLKFVVVMGSVMLIDLFWQLIETGGTIRFASAFEGSSNYHALGRIVSVSFFILVYHYAFVLNDMKGKRIVKLFVLGFCAFCAASLQVFSPCLAYLNSVIREISRLS